MNDVTKTLLYSYPSFDGVLKGISDLIKFKAVTSYKNSNKTYDQMNEIVDLNGKKARIIKLKEQIEALMGMLSQEERSLIEYKYFNRKITEGFDYSSRGYFRKQLRLEKKLDKIAEKNKLTEEWFNEYCWDIYFLRAKYNKIKNVSGFAKSKNAARDRNL